MPSNIQLAAQAIDVEAARLGVDKLAAAAEVVMRLQLRERQLLGFLSYALARESVLADQMREMLAVLD